MCSFIVITINAARDKSTTAGQRKERIRNRGNEIERLALNRLDRHSLVRSNLYYFSSYVCDDGVTVVFVKHFCSMVMSEQSTESSSAVSNPRYCHRWLHQ